MKLYSNGLVYADKALIGIHKETISDLLTLTDERGTYAPFTAANMPSTFRPFTQELYFRFAEWCVNKAMKTGPDNLFLWQDWNNTEELFHLFIQEIQ